MFINKFQILTIVIHIWHKFIKNGLENVCFYSLMKIMSLERASVNKNFKNINFITTFQLFTWISSNNSTIMKRIINQIIRNFELMIKKCFQSCLEIKTVNLKRLAAKFKEYTSVIFICRQLDKIRNNIVDVYRITSFVAVLKQTVQTRRCIYI